MLMRFFQSLKLTEKEQLIVLKLLEIGAQPASVVARQLEIPRNTIRSVMDQLTKRGILVCTRRASTQYYAVESPDNIARALELRHRKLQQEVDAQLSALKESREELQSWTNSISRPRVTFYEGWSGVEKVYEDTLTSKEGKLKSWASYEANAEALSEYFKTYYLRRAKKGIHMTCINPEGPISKEHLAFADRELRTSALVPKSVFTIVPEIQMYDNKVNIVSWKEKLGIIIESQEIADAMKAIFDLSFEAAKKYGKFSKPKRK